MSGVASMMALTGAVSGGSGDPYWSNVALLVHGDTLTDLSSYNHTLTANNRISVKTSPTPPFGTSSIEIGNYSNAVFTTGNLSSPAIGTGDFTIEYTVYADALHNWHTHFGSRNGTNSTYLQQASNKFNVGTTSAGDLFVHRGQGSNVSISAGGFTRLNWHHIVVVRNNGVWGMWRNGTRQVRDTGFANANYSANRWGIGTGATSYAASERLRGHIMNLRFTVGVARYDPDDTTIPTPTELFPTG